MSKAFIQEASYYEAFAKAKIYPRDGSLFLTIDYEGGTILLKLGLDGKISSITLPEAFKTSHSTFLCDSLLFRLSLKFRAFNLKVFDAKNGSLISEKEISDDEAKPEDKIYFHSGKNNVTTNKASLKSAIINRAGAEPTVLANQGAPEKYNITLGTYFIGNGPGVMGAGSPLPMLITFAVTTSINQLGKGPSASLYFHFGYNNGDIDFKKGSEPIFKKFDDFKILYSTREIKFEDIVVTSPREIFVIVHNNNTKMLEVIKS